MHTHTHTQMLPPHIHHPPARCKRTQREHNKNQAAKHVLGLIFSSQCAVLLCVVRIRCFSYALPSWLCCFFLLSCFWLKIGRSVYDGHYLGFCVERAQSIEYSRIYLPLDGMRRPDGGAIGVYIC